MKKKTENKTKPNKTWKKTAYVIGTIFAIVSIIVLAKTLTNNPIQEEKKVKTLILGVDGAEWDVIMPMIKKGKLPNIGKLMNSGYYGDLVSVQPLLSPPAWGSAITGMMPEKHGVKYFYACSDGTPGRDCKGRGKVHQIDSTFLKTNTYFDVISEMGGKPMIMYIPFVGFPVWEVNGIMIGLPKIGNRPEIKERFKVYPETLLSELPEDIIHQMGCIFDKTLADIKLNKTCNGDDLLKDENFKMALDSYSQLNNNADNWSVRNDQVFYRLYNVNRKKNVAKYLMDNYDYDNFMIVFDEGDYMQHLFWRYSDEGHPGYDPKFKDKHDMLIEYMFVELDRIIGELLEDAGENTVVYMVSDHGFRQTFHIHMEPLLKMISQTLGQDITFCIKNDNVKYRLFNEIARIPLCHGKDVEEDAKDISELRRLLKNVKFKESGMPVFDRLNTANSPKIDYYAKINMHGFYGMGNTRILIDGEFEDSEIKIYDMVNLETRSGAHNKTGVYIINGPMIKKGSSTKDIIDIAPTVLYSMGYPIPRYIDGKIIINAFKDDFIGENEIRKLKINMTRDVEHISWGDSKLEKEMLETLKSLGYV